MSKFKIGDLVWSSINGKGQIIDTPGYTQNRETAFITAFFYKSGKYVIYTYDGRESPDEQITLYHYKLKRSKEKLKLLPFQPVLYYKMGQWLPAFFSHYETRGNDYDCILIGVDYPVKIENVISYDGNEKKYSKFS